MGKNQAELGFGAGIRLGLGLNKKDVLGASRTRNRLLRKQVLYPLSYEDVLLRTVILTPIFLPVKGK